MTFWIKGDIILHDMGLFQKSFPYYLRKRFLPEEIEENRVYKNVVIRYVCRGCDKHYTEKVGSLTSRSLKGVPFNRTCSYCGRILEIESLFEDRRKNR